MYALQVFFFFSSRRRHTRYWRDWSSDVCSSDLGFALSLWCYCLPFPISMARNPSVGTDFSRLHVSSWYFPFWCGWAPRARQRTTVVREFDASWVTFPFRFTSSTILSCIFSTRG